MGEMRVMTAEGDVKVMWDAEKEAEVEAARKQFEELVKKSYLAFRVKKDGSKGERIEKFDKHAEALIMVPMVQGG